MGQLSSSSKFVKLQDHTAAGTSTITSAAVDTAGFEGCVLLTSYGTAAADNIANAAQCDTSGGTYADLAGTAVATGTSDEDVWIDVYRPREPFLKMVCVRGTSSTLESIWAILYGAAVQPVDNTTSGTIVGEAHVSPAEGTA
jgi:hypothetical protein